MLNTNSIFLIKFWFRWDLKLIYCCKLSRTNCCIFYFETPGVWRLVCISDLCSPIRNCDLGLRLGLDNYHPIQSPPLSSNSTLVKFTGSWFLFWFEICAWRNSEPLEGHTAQLILQLRFVKHRIMLTSVRMRITTAWSICIIWKPESVEWLPSPLTSLKER